MKLIFAGLAVSVSCCYGQVTHLSSVRSDATATNTWETRFWRSPCCETTYGLVGHEGNKAVPVILKAIDQFSGETNAWIRCQIIQGALYRSACCTNTSFDAIVQRGTNDPSESVRSKTTNMVARGIRRIKQAEPIAAPLPSAPSTGPSEGAR